MATVPTYAGPQVRQQALRPVMQDTPDVSSGLRAMGAAANSIGQVAESILTREARAEADKAEADITASWLEWDATNRRQFIGERAGGYEAAAKDWWDKTAGEYGARLSTTAKQVLGQTLARKRAAAMGAVLTRQGEEVERHAVSVYDAKQNTDIELGVDTGDMAGTAARVRRSAAEFGASRGWSTEQVQEEQQKRLGTLHLTAITRMAQSNPEQATAYYEANKGEIPATAQNKVEQVLKGERDNRFAVQFAAQRAGLPLSDQLAEAGKITDPERREKALQQVRNNHAVVEQAKREREAAASDEAWQLVGQGKRVPEATLARMDGKGRVQLQDYLRERAKQAASGAAVKTDWGLYVELREKLAAGEKVDLRPYAGTRIAGPQLEQLLDIQTRTKDAKKAPEVASAEQQIGTYVDSLKLTGSDKAEHRGQFKAAAQDLFNEYLKKNGKEPDFTERQKLLDQLTTEVVTKPGMLWDTKGPAYTLPRDQLRQRMQAGSSVRVRTVEEARALPPGTRFIDPNGIERIR